MNGEDTIRPVLDRIQQRALIVGGVALAACLLGAFMNLEQFYRSWLLGFIFWAGISLGCLAILMLHHMSGGAWGFVIQRLLESGTRTFPLLAILFLPIVAGMGHLYDWTHEELGSKSRLYLNIPFFLGRAAFYFLVWLTISYFLNKWSIEHDRTEDHAMDRKLQFLSGPGLLLYGLTATFAAVDWVMSLEAHWFSTMYGLTFIVGQGLATLSLMVIVVRLLAEHKPLSEVVRPGHYHDLGNLMFAFVMLWAYIGFSQFLIIWSGNLPEENIWYLHRLHSSAGGWQTVALFLIIFHWALPFLLLLSRRTKRAGQTLARVAGALLIIRLVDLYWLIAPSFKDAHAFRAHWMDVAAPIGIGGVWLWFFAGQLKNRPLLPQGDRRMLEELANAPEH